MTPTQPTPENSPLMHAAANESIEAMFRQGCQLEQELEALRLDTIDWWCDYQAIKNSQP